MAIKKYHVLENLSIIDTESYILNNQYYKDTRITDVIEAGTYTISFYTDSASEDLPSNCSLEKGSSSGVTGDIVWFNRAPVGDMTVRTFTITEPACIWMRFVRTGGRITGSISISRIRLVKGESPYGTWSTIPYRKYGTETDIIATFPADIIADGQSASAVIKGNLTQSGTPTPSAPIYPQETGDKTANLFDYTAYFNSTFILYNEYFDYAELQLQPNTTYTLSTSYREDIVSSIRITAFIVATSSGIPTTVNGGISNISPITITTESDGVLKLYKRISATLYSDMIPTEEQFEDGSWIMLNTGSIALPQEHFGYKIPILSANTTTPAYLGQVQSTRRIKKLVLTGEENWTQSDTSDLSRVKTGLAHIATENRIGFSSHYQYLFSNQNGNCFIGSNGDTIYFGDNINAVDVTTWKTYLQQQYANGTPVCVWYILATETTGIVNEPLRKIGDYSDSVTGTGLPTTGTAEQFDVSTTLKPSEVQLTYHGWHEHSDTVFSNP